MTILRKHFPLLLLYILFAPFFAFVLPSLFTLYPDGLFAAHEHIWSDWPLHYSMAGIFAHKSPGHWFDYHPLFAGGKFTYPFLTNLIPGLIARLGYSLVDSLWVSSYLFIMLMLLALYGLGYQLLKSSWSAFLAVIFFLCSSGWGYIQYFQECFEVGRFVFPDKEYSQQLQLRMYAGNVVKGFLLPQRAFPLGVAFGAFALLFLCMAIDRQQESRKFSISCFCLSAILFGILPIVHVHTLFALFPAVLMLFVVYRQYSRQFFGYSLLGGSVLSLLYMVFVSGGIQAKDFFQWSPGWWIEGGFFHWLYYWFQVFGLMIPVALVALFCLLKDSDRSQAKVVLAAGFVPFMVDNLVLSQPSAWDNTKLFFWSYFFFSCLAADLCRRLFKTSRNEAYVFAALLILQLSLTGVLELLSLFSLPERHLPILSGDELRLAQQIREQTPEESVFLVAPRMNSFVMIAGERSIVLGYLEWVRNFGFEYKDRLADIIRIYDGENDALALLRKYNVQYVVIGFKERRAFPKLREDFFRCHLPIAFEAGTTAIYHVEEFRPTDACLSNVIS